MLSAVLRELFLSLDDLRRSDGPLDQMTLTIICGVIAVCLADAERLEAAAPAPVPDAAPTKSAPPLLRLVPSAPSIDGGGAA